MREQQKTPCATVARTSVVQRGRFRLLVVVGAVLSSGALLASPAHDARATNSASPSSTASADAPEFSSRDRSRSKGDTRIAKRAKRRPPPTTTAPPAPVQGEGSQVPPTPAPSPASASGDSGSADDGSALEGRRSGPSRIEFDDRLIQGQTNKANAIYLFERRASELRSLVRPRQHYHKEIDESVR